MADKDPPGLWLIGMAQPRLPAADRPDYDGTMMMPHEQDDLVSHIDSKRMPMPAVMEHAGLSKFGDLPAPEQVIGEGALTWRDPQYGLMMAVKVPGHRPESLAIPHALLNEGKKIGFSLFTDLQIEGGDIITGKVKKLRPTHVGATYTPAWAKEGSYVYEFGTEDEMMRTVLRDKYGKRPGVTFPPNMAKMLAETERGDAQRISAHRAERQRNQEKGHLFGSTVMASDAPPPATPPAAAVVPPAVDKMDVVAPTSVLTPPAPAPAKPAAPSYSTKELLAGWKNEHDKATKAQTIHERVERLKLIRADLGAALKAGKIDADEYWEAGGKEFEQAVREEIKKLDEQAMGYLNMQLEKRQITPDAYMAHRSAIMASVPPTNLDELRVSRLTCTPVRASAEGHAHSQKEIETLREQHKLNEDNKRKYDVLQKEYDDLKAKMGDLDKLTTKNVAAAMMGKPTATSEPPKLVHDEKGAVDTSSTTDAVEAAGEDVERIGEWGRRSAWESFVKPTWAAGGTPGIDPFKASYADLSTTKSSKGTHGFGFAFSYKEETPGAMF